MNQSPAIHAVISDLGRVVFEFSFAHTFEYVSKHLRIPLEEVTARFVYDEQLARLERGEIELDDYRRHVEQMVGLAIPFDVFQTAWNMIFNGPVAGIKEVMAQLEPQVRLVALSNTNACQTEIWEKEYRDILQYFERVFVSHKMGARKPEPRCYRMVLDYLQVEPRHVLFIDDSLQNVEGAKALGIHAVQMTTTEELIPKLQSYGLNVT